MPNKPNSPMELDDPPEIYFPALDEAFFVPEPEPVELPPHYARMRARLLEASEFEIRAALVEALGMRRQTRAQRRRYLAHLSPRVDEEMGG